MCLQVAFKYALSLASLIDQDSWKGIEHYKDFAEGEAGNQGILRSMGDEPDFEDDLASLPQAGEGEVVTLTADPIP
jgi:hypothetical protein